MENAYGSGLSRLCGGVERNAYSEQQEVVIVTVIIIIVIFKRLIKIQFTPYGLTQRKT